MTENQTKGDSAISKKKQEVEAIYPLSPMQEGMLFHSVSDPDSCAYFEQYTCTYKGKFNTDHYKQAWQTLVDHHPILRTLVVWERNDRPLQVVRPQLELEWHEEDIRTLGADTRSEKLRTYLSQDLRRGFDVTKAPLMRMALLRTADDEYRFVWSFHHLLLDGWSTALLFKSLFSLYRALCDGRHLEPEAVPPYRNHIAWLQKQDLSKVESYWTQRLQGFEHATDVRVGKRSVSRNDESHYDRLGVNLSAAAIAKLQVLSRKHQVTLNTIAQGAWALLLSRYSGESDVMFGGIVSGRPVELPGVDEMIGLFINTLPVRVSIDADAPVFEWLKTIQIEQLESKDFEHSSLLDVKKWSDIQKSEPLFESILVFENYPSFDFDRLDLEFSICDEHTFEQTDYPLSIGVEPENDFLLSCIYDCSKFDADTIGRLLEHFKKIFEAFADDPSQSLQAISLLSAKDLYQLTTEFNQTEVALSGGKCIHEQFRETALRHAGNLSVSDVSVELSYAELDRRSDALATILQGKGIGPDNCVAVLLNRTSRLPVALLAVLKAGGAYLPVDPKCPAERLQFMLEDAGSRVVISERALSQQLPDSGVDVIVLDEAWGELDGDNVSPAQSVVTLDDLAYVIYTSGSSGLPKGVEVSHRSLHNLLSWHRRTYDVTADDRASMLAGLAFDAAVWEIWPYLVSGASLHIPDEDTRLSPPLVLEWLTSKKISLCFMPTPLAEAVLQEEISDDIALRYLLTGGDKLHAPASRMIPFKLVNHYGPTEYTVVSTAVEIDISQPVSADPSIGRPIDNTLVYVLDENRMPVPIGVPGELYVAGAGLARGYLNNPKLTATSFVANPFVQESNAKMYCTGDLVRLSLDGNLEFLGRIDHQVKIRGYRVELGEIEFALGKMDEIQSAIVLVREIEPGVRSLIAYLVSESGDVPTLAELRQRLSASLPDYMIPARFVALEEWPLTTNGKVDRKALPEPAGDSIRSASEYVVAKSKCELLLAEIWRDVLRLGSVGIHDNFFELGGDSILSLQIISRAKRAGISLTPRQIFDFPTIGELATVADSAEIAIAEQGPISGKMPLTPIQHWFLDQEILSMHHWNQAYLLKLPEDTNPEALQRALIALVAHHDALRIRFNKKDGQWHAVNLATVELSFAQFDLREFDGAAQANRLFELSSTIQSKLDPASGHLLRCALFDLGRQEKRLLIAIHHLVVDGVSWRILLDDLATVYDQIIDARKTVLPAKTLSFKAWAEKQSDYANSSAVLKELNYWQSVSEDAQAIPVDEENYDENTQESAEVISVSLSRAETRALLTDAQRSYRTRVNDFLLTALVQALLPWCKGDSLVFEMEGHGREELGEALDLSRTVGWFTGKYPQSLTLGAATEIGEILVQVKEQLSKVPNQGIGYGMLRYLAEADTANSLPNCESGILFNYLGQFDQMFFADGLIQRAPEDGGSTANERGKRTHVLEVNALVVDGLLRIEWTYSRNLHRKETIEGLACRYLSDLRKLIEHCVSPDVGALSPADFPFAILSPKTLEKLISQAVPEKNQVGNVKDIYALTPMQAGMHYHSMLEPESGLYFEQYRCTFNAEIDQQCLQDAWQLIVARHDVLRTAFFWDGTESSHQVVFREVDLPYSFMDWREYSSQVQQDRMLAYLRDDKAKGIDLGVVPLMRIALIQIGDTEFHFVWSYHHLLLDGWSLPLLWEEFLTYYERLRCDQEIQYVQPRPYRQYIEWLQNQDRVRAQEFWTKELAGFSTGVALDGLEREDKEEGEDTVEIQFTIERNATTALQSFAKRHRLTLNTVFQGAWALLLSRYSGQNDIVFGATVSGRPAAMPGVEGMVGLFINTVPVRARIDEDQSIVSFLRSLQSQQLAVREFEHSSLVDIHTWSEIPHSQPLFESLLVFENYPLGEQSSDDGLRAYDEQLSEKTNFPLNIMVQPGAEIVVDLLFDSSRLSDKKVARISGHMRLLLDTILADAEAPIAELSILSASERRLLNDWNDTAVDSLGPSCIHRCVQEQVQKTPDRIAIRCSDTEISFLELERRSNKLAHYLQTFGLAPGDIVGLSTARSIDMIVGMLGVLKTGAAYLPIDPDYPEERIQFILSDAKVSLLLTQSELIPKLPDVCDQVVLLDDDWPAIEKEDDSTPVSPVSARDIAYVIYTSGSTGKPKGVQVPHDCVTNFLASMAKEPGITEDDVFLSVTTLSFDIAVLELFLPLVTGARIELADRESAADGHALLQRIMSSGVTIMQATPATWRLMLSAGWQEGGGLKVLCGGEVLSSDLAAQLLERASSVWNMYGPTETTVWSTICRLENAEHPIPIGKPIANTQVFVLDKMMRQQPIGVAGEMYIGGAGVTLGYRNQAALTAERFIDLAINGTSSSLYRSGDLVRFRESGNIEYISRLDDQIKLRGYRIELGEIETVLCACRGIEQSVVIVRESKPGDMRLLAYYVVNAGEDASVPKIRKHLRSQLPDYMIPQHYIEIDSIPLTPNGKINSRKLPLPSSAGASMDKFVHPRSGEEIMLAKIWTDILGVEQVSVHDNFFEVGGHSLLSIQVISRVKETSGVTIDLRSMVIDTLEQIASGMLVDLD